MRPNVRPVRFVLLAVALASGCAGDRLYRKGIEAYDRGNYEEAMVGLEQAVRDDPTNLEYRYELRSRRERAVQNLLATGDALRARGEAESAVVSYRRALVLQPNNDRALRGLDLVTADRRHAERTAKAAQLLAAKKPELAELEVKAVLSEDPTYAPAAALQAKLDLARGPVGAVPRLRTKDDKPVSLQFRDAPTKMVFEALARQTGLNFVFDKEVKTEGKTTVFVNQVPVEQAIDLILAQSQLGRQVLSESVVLIYPNTPAKQKDYRDEIVHTFYLTNATPKDAETMLKTVLGTKTLFVDDKSSTLVMRDTPEHVRMAEKLVASLDVAEPEVIMEVEVLELSHSLAEQLGINYPTSFSMSTTKPPNSSGSGTGLVLSDLGKQTANTIAVSSLGISVDLSKTVGAANLLSSPRLRARNKEKAKILVGNRLPVVTSGTSATTGGTFATSNVQYIDVGLTVEVQPTIRNDGNVAIKVQLEVSTILKQISVPIGNGATTLAYEIGTRNTNTLLELKDGETQVLAGLIQDIDQQSSSHIPGLGDIPILGRLFGSKGTTRDKNEIVMSITPRIVRARSRPSSETLEFWYGSESQTRSGPFASVASLSSSGVGPTGPGSVSFGAGGAADTATPPSGPRPKPERLAAAAGAPPPPAPPTDANAAASGADGAAGAATGAAAGAVADAGAGAAAGAATGSAAGDKPKVSIEGPETAKVGEEIAVAVRLASGTPLGRIRTQVAFDAVTLQLVAAEPGDLAGDAKVETRAGGVQLDISGTADAPVGGNGNLVSLRFKVVAARPASVTTQVVLVGADGVAVAATQATPLKISVEK